MYSTYKLHYYHEQFSSSPTGAVKICSQILLRNPYRVSLTYDPFPQRQLENLTINSFSRVK